MTIEVNTHLKLSDDPVTQKAQVLPIFLHLHKQHVSNLYFSRNESGCLVIWIDMTNPLPKSLSDYFAGLTNFSIDFHRNLAFIPAHSIKVTSSIDVCREHLKSPIAQTLLNIMHRRLDSFYKRNDAFIKLPTEPDPFSLFGTDPSDISRKIPQTVYTDYGFYRRVTEENVKKARYAFTEGMYLLYLLENNGITIQLKFPDRAILSSSADTNLDISDKLNALQAPRDVNKIGIIDEKEACVTLTFKPKTNLGMRLAEHDSATLFTELFQLIYNRLVLFDKIEWIRNCIGKPTSMIFFAAGIKQGTIQFEYNGLRGVDAFSITLCRLRVTKRAFNEFKNDVKLAMYQSAIEEDHNFTAFEMKRDLVQSNAKKLNKLTESFNGNKPQWQIHRDNANARFTLFSSKDSQADALETHLRAGGLTLFKRGQMTQSKREIVTVDLAHRDSPATAAASSSTP